MRTVAPPVDAWLSPSAMQSRIFGLTSRFQLFCASPAVLKIPAVDETNPPTRVNSGHSCSPVSTSFDSSGLNALQEELSPVDRWDFQPTPGRSARLTRSLRAHA